jgi:hypothetical protein
MTSRDYWYLSSVTLILLAIIIGAAFIWHGLYETYSWGTVVSFIVASAIITYGSFIGAFCGLVSYFKKGRKARSLTIFFVCITVGIAPKVYMEFNKVQQKKEQQAMIGAMSPTQRLFYLIQGLQEEEKQKEFVIQLKNNANINAINQYGAPLFIKGVDRALHSRGYRRDIFIDFLIKHGADVNIQSNDGSTALHYAARKHDVEIVEKLLNYGADPTIVTIDGESPLDWVNSQFRPNMPEILKKELDRTVLMLEQNIENRAHAH